ncbi:MAG: hypothetical protein NTW86_04250 [Candidatus Sumerlaeota bacterium]|nr:hypothetical protein [Candidatus Sumerlaeota bacterium]
MKNCVSRVFYPPFFLGLALATAGCLRCPAEPLSPGELPPGALTLEKRRGAENPARRAIAVVLNRRGEALVGMHVHPPDKPLAIVEGRPSGGQRIVSDQVFELMVEVARRRSDIPPMGLRSQTAQEIYNPAASRYALIWVLPDSERRGDESALDNALRAVADEVGAPPDRLSQEFFYFDKNTETAYFRFRYTGDPKDGFLFNDPAKARGAEYNVSSAWGRLDTPQLQMLMAYLQIADGVDYKIVETLFDY